MYWLKKKKNEVKKMTTGYCVKCRKKVEMKNPKTKKNKRNMRVAQGTCPKCGTGVYRILGK